MKKKEIKDIINKIESEGFDYCFGHYSDFSDIKDPTFHELRKAYLEAASSLASFLKEECDDLGVDCEDFWS